MILTVSRKKLQQIQENLDPHREAVAWGLLCDLLEGTEEQHRDEPVAWSPVKPSTPGAYWVRGNGLDQDALIQVIDDQGELRCNLHQRTTEADFGWGYAVSDLSEGFEWLGPLFTRADAGEVERLRLERRRMDQALSACANERDTLHAQLTERDALLDDIAKRHWSGVDFDLPADLVARIKSLSASAEPSAPVDRDEQELFESVFPIPRHTTKFKGGYAATEFNAWDAHKFCDRWDGWKTRAALERKP